MTWIFCSVTVGWILITLMSVNVFGNMRSMMTAVTMLNQS